MNSYFIPNVNLMGAGCASETGNETRKMGGRKALVVSDRQLLGQGITPKITAYLNEVGIETVIYDGTLPNPTIKNVNDGLALYKSEKCDSIVAVGGGSPIDCAKGVGLLVNNEGCIRDYEGLDKSEKPMPPFIAVNTTAGTASEMSRFISITDTERQLKMTIVDRNVTPSVSINDPELMMSMPSALTAATGMGALTHAIEAFVSTQATPLTDSAALTSIELINSYLRPAVANGYNMESREKMIYAQFLAGMAFNNAGLGLVHAMSHQLGGFYNLPHGLCNAILLPYVLKFNTIACAGKLVKIANALGEKTEGLWEMEAAGLASYSIKRMGRDVGIPSGLRELGVKEDDLPILANHALKDVCSATNPRLANQNEIIEIYRQAM